MSQYELLKDYGAFPAGVTLEFDAKQGAELEAVGAAKLAQAVGDAFGLEPSGDSEQLPPAKKGKEKGK